LDTTLTAKALMAEQDNHHQSFGFPLLVFAANNLMENI